jgi:hypothetical protein
MGGAAMSRYWTGLPALVMVGVPVWTAPSDLVVAIEVLALLLCAVGILTSALAPVTGGGILGTIGYAVAVGGSAGGVDVVGATAFGLALLFLLDLSEFARRRRGTAISVMAMRGQRRYWLARAAVIVGAVAVLLLCGSIVALIVPGAARAVVAGAGVMIAFAGALRAGASRAEP